MAYAIIFLPLAFALLAAAIPSNRVRPWLLPVAGVSHLVLTLCVLAQGPSPASGAWIGLDAAGRLILPVISVLFACVSFGAVAYLGHRQERPNRVFCACLTGFLGLTSLVVWSRHLGLMWVAIEATTLVTAPLIYFNHTPRSIEATWKYLLVGSVGIALALLGTFALAYAALHGGLAPTLDVGELLAMAPALSRTWLKVAFVLMLVGYGTKMGLAPMHTWKPDAYGEAPGLVGALLAGGVTSCAFLALLRIHHICRLAGVGDYAGRLLIFMGLLSMAVAALFMIGQRDFKRMLAYSSVEHMGILALGLGIGGPALYGVLLHVLTNGAAKGALFLAAGNIHRAYGSKLTSEVGGALQRLPVSGALFLAAFLAITGSPPFGPFVSEFMILTGAIAQGRFLSAGLFLVFLFAVFIGMGATVLKVIQGRPSEAALATPYRDTALSAGPIVVLMALTLLPGLHLPFPLRGLLDDAVRFLGGPA